MSVNLDILLSQVIKTLPVNQTNLRRNWRLYQSAFKIKRIIRLHFKCVSPTVITHNQIYNDGLDPRN